MHFTFTKLHVPKGSCKYHRYFNVHVSTNRRLHEQIRSKVSDCVQLNQEQSLYLAFPKATMHPTNRENKKGQIYRHFSQSDRCRARGNMTQALTEQKMALKQTSESEVRGLNVPLSGFFGRWCSSFGTPLSCSIGVDIVRW
jgi:hypothetical protein